MNEGGPDYYPLELADLPKVRTYVEVAQRYNYAISPKLILALLDLIDRMRANDP